VAVYHLFQFPDDALGDSFLLAAIQNFILLPRPKTHTRSANISAISRDSVSIHHLILFKMYNNSLLTYSLNSQIASNSIKSPAIYSNILGMGEQ